MFSCEESALPKDCLQMISELQLQYEVLKNADRERVFLRVLRRLNEDLEVSGPTRHGCWEAGWGESPHDFSESHFDISKLAPRYDRRNEVSQP
jgi:hypothetical protein